MSLNVREMATVMVVAFATLPLIPHGARTASQVLWALHVMTFASMDTQTQTTSSVYVTPLVTMVLDAMCSAPYMAPVRQMGLVSALLSVDGQETTARSQAAQEIHRQRRNAVIMVTATVKIKSATVRCG